MSDDQRPIEPRQVAGPTESENRLFESSCFAIAVGKSFFVAREDWTDNPAFAMKYGRIRVASGRAQDEREKFPNEHVRVVRIKQQFVVEEIE